MLQYFLVIKEHVNIAHILDYAAMLFYQGSILYTQSQYFADENECSEQSIELHRWFLTEIITFYGLLASAVVYLLFAAVFQVKTDKFVFQKERCYTDFITWSQELYRYFGMTMTLLMVSIITYAIYDQEACKHDNLNNPGSALIPTHIC